MKTTKILIRSNLLNQDIEMEFVPEEGETLLDAHLELKKQIDQVDEHYKALKALEPDSPDPQTLLGMSLDELRELSRNHQMNKAMSESAMKQWQQHANAFMRSM